MSDRLSMEDTEALRESLERDGWSPPFAARVADHPHLDALREADMDADRMNNATIAKALEAIRPSRYAVILAGCIECSSNASVNSEVAMLTDDLEAAIAMASRKRGYFEDMFVVNLAQGTIAWKQTDD